MDFKHLLTTLLLLISALCFAQTESSDNQYSENRNKPEREAWLQDQGFGLFIHFNYDAQLGITISHSLVGASEDYLDRYFNELPKTFDPDKFDAYQVAKLAKVCGVKYIVFTTKHVSGFCFWDTKTTDFNIMNTPYQTDFVKQYVDGVRKAGLAVGFYYSPEDFKFLYDRNITISRWNITYDEPTLKAYNKMIKAQTEELFTNYGKIDVLFIDSDLKEACRNTAWALQPDVVITRGAINTPEQTVPGAILDQFWESCITMGTQWNYKPTNDDIKSGGKLIQLLIETRAKGGNLLLNVGLHPDGYVPYEQETPLREMGAWNFINQEAIEKVRPWIIPNEENIWLTASKDKKTVYAILTNLPDWAFGARKNFVLKSVNATPDTKISVLGQNGLVAEYQNNNDVKSTFQQEKDGLHISVARAQRIYDNFKWPNPIVVKLENIESALNPPFATTLNATQRENKVALQGELMNMGDASQLEVGFEYQEYAGFAENLNFNNWKRSNTITVNQSEPFSVPVDGLDPNKSYQYRTVIVHPKITLHGNIKILPPKQSK